MFEIFDFGIFRGTYWTENTDFFDRGLLEVTQAQTFSFISIYFN